jgi:RHS repeat-associated protein
MTYRFGFAAPLQWIQDRYGNRITLTRSPAITGNVTRIDGPSGRYLVLTYDASNRIVSISDNIGRTALYEYDLLGRMTKTTYPDGSTNQYVWDNCPGGNVALTECSRIISIKDGRGNITLTNEYDATPGAVAVVKQTYADASTNFFQYTKDGTGKPLYTDVTDERGNIRRVAFNANGYVASDTYAFGKPEQQVFTFARSTLGDFVADETDPLGRVTHTERDTLGNVTSVTKLYGTPQAVTTSFTYEPLYQQIATITDPLGHTVTFGYDAAGYLTSMTDPLTHTTNFTNNLRGQILTITDALLHQTLMDYDGADLVKVTDPLGRATTRFSDGVGRLISTIDPLGNTTRMEYDGINRLTKVIDSLGNTIQYTYDVNGNLVTHKDQRGNNTQFSYDLRNRLQTRTDALTKVENYVYDLGGNLTRVTDRKGQVTGYTYDALNRRTQVGFGATVAAPTTYQNTITYTYDGGNRATVLVDSTNGTINRTHDGLDRRTQEVTPQGTVNYTYDTASRRATMQVVGQANPVIYGYDNADRLTTVTQGASVVSIGYDNANRRTSLVLPNGVAIGYSYDNANQLSAIAYVKGAATLGTLSYTYDKAGRRLSQDGTYARTGLPAAVPSRTYDANNRITAQGTTTYTYDLNGDLIGDGANTYTWNSRNQLSAISGSVAASFQYDAVGRRRTKIVAGTTTKFLYDGENLVQEMNASNVATANLLTGLDIDEVYSRTHPLGTEHLLADALGSTLALADSSGVVQTSYTYEPFGKSSRAGAVTTNTQTYTGREDDGTGLYYYRARYYHPILSRFISEDPLGIVAGPNSYAYVGGNPLSYSDPLGLNPAAGALGGAQIGSFAGPIGSAVGALIGGIGGYIIADKLSDVILNSGDGDDAGNSGSEAPAGGHDSGIRPSTKEKHQKGDERRRRDQGGEKKDDRMPYDKSGRKQPKQCK